MPRPYDMLGRRASNEAATEQVQASLIASVDAVHAGERLVLGVHQRIAAGWHLSATSISTDQLNPLSACSPSTGTAAK